MAYTIGSTVEHQVEEQEVHVEQNWDLQQEEDIGNSDDREPDISDVYSSDTTPLTNIPAKKQKSSK